MILIINVSVIEYIDQRKFIATHELTKTREFGCFSTRFCGNYNAVIYRNTVTKTMAPGFPNLGRFY